MPKPDAQIIIGPSSIGKRISSEYLKNNGYALHLSTGDAFRAILSKEELSDIELEIKKAIESGMLVSDTQTDLVVLNKVISDIKNEIYKSGNIYLLDGYPRTIPQAMYSLKLFNITKVIRFSGGETFNEELMTIQEYAAKKVKEAIANNKKPRNDDLPEVVPVKYQQFLKQTMPVVHFMKGNNIPIVNVYNRFKNPQEKLFYDVLKAFKE